MELDASKLTFYPSRVRNAMDYYNIADLIYSNLKDNQSFKSIECHSVFKVDNSNTGYYGISFLDLRTNKKGLNRPKIIIAHRGTDDRMDILTDYQIAKQEIPNQFSDACLLTLKTLNFFRNEIVDVIHIGHSLGAALAQMCAHKYGHKSMGFETPIVKNILNVIDSSHLINNENHVSFIMLGSYISNSKPSSIEGNAIFHAGQVFQCMSKDFYVAAPIENIEKLHRLKNLKNCVKSIDDFGFDPRVNKDIIVINGNTYVKGFDH